MKSTKQLVRSLSLVISLCVSLLTGERQVFPNDGPQQTPVCRIGKQAPPNGSWTWPPNIEVRVYIVTADFRPDQIEYLLRPLENWNAVAELTGSNVRFVYSGPTVKPQVCNGCLTIMRGPVLNKRDAAELEGEAEGRKIVTHLRMILESRIDDNSALTNAVAHELGHSFGLLDCYSCDRNSVMGGIRKSNGLEGPTACDVAQIKSGYEQVKKYLRSAKAKPPPKLIVDEGEEPVEDDTPITIPPPRQ